MRTSVIFLFVLLLCLVPAFAITNTVFNDVDGDGDLDLFLETYIENNGSNYIVRNVTSGIPQLPGVTQAYFVNVGFTAAEDLYVVRSGLQNYVYFSLGNGSFTNVTGTALGMKLTGAPSVNTGTVFADFDSDSDYDAFVNGQFYVTNGSFASLNCTSESNLGELPGMRHMFAQDMNGDSTLDIVGVTVAGGNRLMLNVGDTNNDDCPEFYEAQQDVQLDQLSGVNFISVGNISAGVAINDTLTYFPFTGVLPPFVADRFVDLYFARSTENILAIQLWPETPIAYSDGGNAQFNLPRFADKSDGSNVNISAATTSSLIADFDNNNFNDVLVGGAASNSNIYLRNSSTWNQSFVLDTTTGLPSIANMKLVQAADLDGDSALDLAIIDAQQICDGVVTSAGSSTFQTTGSPGMSADPGPGGASVSDVTADLILSSQLDNIVLSNSSPFIVFIDAFEIAVNALTGHAIVTGGNFDCSLVTLASEPAPDLTLSVNGLPATVVQGNDITYTITLTPTTGVPLNVGVINTYPAGVTFSSSVPAPTTPPGTWDVGNLTGAYVITITASTVGAPLGTATDTVVVTWQDTSGNNYTTTATVNNDIVTPNSTSLSINLSGPATATAGDTITFSIDISLTSGNASDLNITYVLPPGFSFVSASPTNTSSGPTWALGDFVAPATIQVNVTVSINSSTSGNITSTATVEFENASGGYEMIGDSFVTFVNAPVSAAGAAGGGGGGGYSRINQFLIVDKVTVNNMGQNFVVGGLKFGDNLKIAGTALTSVQFDGYVVATNPDKGRIMKAQQVLVQMGNLKQTTMTDENGRFTALFSDLRNLQLGDQGKDLTIWFSPELSDSPEQRRIGNTYQQDYSANPTLNFATPPPGIDTQYPFSPGVWFNGVLLTPIQVYVPPVVPVMPEVPGEVVPETPVTPPAVTPPVVVEPPKLGFFGGLFAVIEQLVGDILISFTPVTPATDWYDFNGPAPGNAIENWGDIPGVGDPIPGPNIFPEDDVPPPETPKTSISLPPPPEVPSDCNLACTTDGTSAIFTYSPAGCGVDFTQECAYAYTKGSSAFNKYVNDQMDACCSLTPPGTGVPPSEGPGPFPEPGFPVPPAEEVGCKLVCNYQAPSAVFSYVPTGDLACKSDFRVSCGETSGGPGNYSGHEGLSPGELLWVNTYLKECCDGTSPPALTGEDDGGVPKVPGDPKKGQPPVPGACIEKRTPYCAVEGLWLTGGLGSKELRPAVYAVLVERIPDPAGTLACIPSWTEIGQAPYNAAGGTDDCISIDYCGQATRYACVDGGGAFRQDAGEVGPQCADGADGDNGGSGTFPCDPCTDQQFFACGSVVENAYFIGGAGGGLAGSMPVDAPLQAIVGQSNYDACCGTSTTPPAFYAAECSTTATESACSYYSTYKGQGLPFFRSNTIETSGAGCEEESSSTDYSQCTCTDMLYEYGACGSAELNARASLSYEASLVRSSCCPSAFVPGDEPFTRIPPPVVVPFPVPEPDTPPIEVPPPDVPPPTIMPRPELPIDVTRPVPVRPVENPVTITAPINPNPPPAIDFCVPADASAGVQTEIISNDEAQTILESSEAAFPEEYVPQDYELIESVRVDACQSQQLSFRRSISNQYQDVHVFRCQNGVCSWVSDETNPDASCEDESLERILSGDQARVLEVAQMGVVTTIGEEVNANDRTISTGRYNVEFTGNLPSGVVSLGRPDGRVTLPRNTGLVLVGTPLVITVESAPATARITLPVTPIETATSYSVFGMVGSGWIEVGGTYNADAGTITVDVNNFDTFVKNNKAVFAVMAYTSQATSDSCVMMKEDGNDELIVLVHGFTSNVNTWKPFVTQAYVGNEPYDIVAFQYSPEQTTDAAAKSLMSCLSTVAGNYKSYNVVAHSVGAVITNKALGEMNKNPDAYPTVYTVDKVISLGMPNKGIDVFVMNRLADVLANYPTLATVFDRRSVIAQELVNPEWSNLTVAPEWAQHIGVAGTVECDFSQMLTDVTDRPSAGGAFSIIDPIQRFTRANDCVVTVKNALEHIPNQELCSNTFTPNVWHIALNDDSKVRQLIFYLINSEKAKADPTRGFAGYNQYVSWVDGCSPGAVYGIVGKKATAQKPLFCNCGDGVCDATIGETENTCPIDCFGWNMFVCTLLKNLSNLLLALFGAGFLVYATRKHALNKEVDNRRWKMALWGTLGVAAAMLVIAAMLCPTVPVAGLLLTLLLGGLLFAENTLSRSAPPSKPLPPKSLKGQKAQVSMEKEVDEWDRRYQELKRRESVLRKFKV